MLSRSVELVSTTISIGKSHCGVMESSSVLLVEDALSNEIPIASSCIGTIIYSISTGSSIGGDEEFLEFSNSSNPSISTGSSIGEGTSLSISGSDIC